MIVQQIISGLALGCVYGLIALGFVLIFKATEVINFAQGEMMMIGAFVAYALITMLNVPLDHLIFIKLVGSHRKMPLN